MALLNLYLLDIIDLDEIVAVDIDIVHQEIMGSHHHQGAILVPDDKLECFGHLENIFAWSNMV